MNNIRRITLYNCLMQKKFKLKNATGILFNINRYSTTTQSSVEEFQPLEDEILNISKRILRKKPQINSPIKDLFVNDFNKELLAFPEVLNKSEIEALSLRTNKIENLLLSNKNSTFSKICDDLKQTRMLGAPATVFHGGYEAISTERCKFLETFANNIDIATYVKNHWMCLNFVKLGLQSENFDIIMQSLTSRDIPITMCLKEQIASSPSLADMRCKSYRNVDNQWVISGEKLVNNAQSGYFIVACAAEQNLVNFYLVLPDAPGVKITPTSITFIETPATLLGDSNYDPENLPDSTVYSFAKEIFSQNRLETSAICLGLLRLAIIDFIEITRNKYIGGKPFGELQLVQKAINDAVSTTYAIESMTYFTAGLIDGYEKPDFDIECCICRIFATRETHKTLIKLVDIIGIDNLSESHLKYLDNSRLLMLNEEQNDKLSIYSGLIALQYTSLRLSNIVRQIRNPFMHPTALVKKIINDRRQDNDSPTLNLYLHENFHPSLQDSSRILEYMILRMQYGTEKIFIEHGMDIIEKHMSINRLTETIISVYASMCSLSRSSRAYCIGLYNGDNEMVVANYLTKIHRERVSKLVSEMVDGMYVNKDIERENIAKKSLNHGRSHYEHCLERVFF